MIKIIEERMNDNTLSRFPEFPIIPAFLMAQSVLNNSDNWTNYFEDDKQRTLLFLLSPIISFCLHLR